MNTTDLMLQFSNPATIASIPFGDKLLACLITTALGMGITFCALILLMFVISLMEKAVKPAHLSTRVIDKPPRQATEAVAENDLELTAIITVVLAHHLHAAADDIVIRNISRINDQTPAWGRLGILEQINDRM